MTSYERLKLDRAITKATESRSVRELAQGWVRYEKLRLLKPHHYAELSKRNLAGEGSFDDLVDRLEGLQ